MRASAWMLVAALAPATALAPVHAQEAAAQPPPRAADDANDAALQAGVDDLVRIVGKQFDDRWDRPPVVARAPRDVMDLAVQVRLDNLVRADRLEARGRAWKDIGLGDPAAPRRLWRALVAGLTDVGLDTSGGRLLVTEELYRVDTAFEGEEAQFLWAAGVHPDEPIVAHGLVRLRQMERRGGDRLGPTTDEALASSAWGAGEANLVALRLLFDGMGLADSVLTPLTSPGDFLDGRLLPRGLSRLPMPDAALVRFVYEDGFGATVERFRRGGWSGVTAAANATPTTRAVLHGGADSLSLDGQAEPTPAEGFVRVDVDRIGEHGVFALISGLTGKDSLALEAADGWTDDALIRWERGAEGLTQWVTRWRDAEAVKDFLYAWRRGLSEGNGGGTWAAVGDDWRWIGAEREAFLDVDGLTVTAWIGEGNRVASLVPVE